MAHRVPLSNYGRSDGAAAVRSWPPMAVGVRKDTPYDPPKEDFDADNGASKHIIAGVGAFNQILNAWKHAFWPTSLP